MFGRSLIHILTLCYMLAAVMSDAVANDIPPDDDKMDADNLRRPVLKSQENDNQGISESQSRNNPKPIRLSDDPACRENIVSLCKTDLDNNFAVLECLQNNKINLLSTVSIGCHHVLWNYKFNLTRNEKILTMTQKLCEAEFVHLQECKTKEMNPGHMISCMTDNLPKIKDEQCHQYVSRLAAIVFSDYRLIEGMASLCHEDINRFQCGRIQSLAEETPHSQGDTTECLMKHAKDLNMQCHKQIFRLAELQSDDFHLDRPLYFACRDDRERFCSGIRSGEGRVYKCLMAHQKERGMNKECLSQLLRRQTLIAEDYKVSRGLVSACQVSIEAFKCRRGTREDEQDVKLSRILLCLEGNLRQGNPVDSNCQGEMLSHRRMLMDNYQLSPSLVVECKEEIKTLCNGGLETGGLTLHCLMKFAKNKRRRNHPTFSPKCRREVEDLVKQTDAGEDWRVDPVLQEACQRVVETSCQGLRGGQARIMRCLMRHLQKPEMVPACEAALLEIQYFVARDWKLDPQLYSACANDSVRLCHASHELFETAPSTLPENSVQVLPCLFRYAYHPLPQMRLNNDCTDAVHRVMHERAAYVELHPEIEMTCMEDLAMHCSEETGPGQELACLQNHLEILDKDCKDVVSNYTSAEAEDTHLNAQVMLFCRPVISQLCSDLPKQAMEDGSVMDCLISQKNDPVMKDNPKCRAVVEDFQLVTLKDINFSPKFKEECHQDVARFCKSAKTKLDIIECLSGIVRNAVLNEDRSLLSKGCRQQLKLQLTQQHESVRLDPKLHDACVSDIGKFCADVSKGKGRVMECLRTHQKELSESCRGRLFTREEDMMVDPSTDVVLLQNCRQMIRQFCSDVSTQEMLTCLKRNRANPDFEPQCRSVVFQRLMEQAADVRLNPELKRACQADIKKFCGDIFRRGVDGPALNGKVTECLKEQLPSQKLSPPCSVQVMGMARSAALDYNMDPVLKEKCMDDMRTLCSNYLDIDGHGQMQECLKLFFDQGKIQSKECSMQVARLIETQRADLRADPVLNEVCIIDDVKFCEQKKIGYHLLCLFDVLDRNPTALQVNCREKLRERKELYNNALKVVKLESLQDLVYQVSSSPEKNYLILVGFSLLGIIFVGGLMCGRVTKRYQRLKDR